MEILERDKAILRWLAEKVAEIADLPVQKEKAEMWRRMNQLKPVKPMVWINEIPWHEMDVNGELEIQSTHPFARRLEGGLRRTIYQWEHMPGDMVVERKIYSPIAIRDTGFGIREVSDVVRIDARGVASRRFHPQIRSEKDLERIKMPVITHDAEASERNYQVMVDIFGDILEVERGGVAGMWFAPWDQLVTWWGVEQVFMDLLLRPELVHAAVDRLVNAHLSRLDQLERLNLLALNNRNVRIGSGGYGYTDELPQEDFDPNHVRAIDLWGCATAQIFSGVSPQMHEEFALKYERRWLERFGLTYYGCCEPLHHKVGILKNIPNLRKISMSPWADLEVAVEEIGDRYVISYKPNPAVLAVDEWNPEYARKELRRALERTVGCAVEVIMKDISTVRYEPQRLWEWARIAAEETERFIS
ncbi:TPA: hypothetical protein EYP37_09865 [Candidatus Poribacteria bacterium]|nr:hypothetical protein [Candidatus Poribacteria bacterium]